MPLPSFFVNTAQCSPYPVARVVFGAVWWWGLRRCRWDLWSIVPIVPQLVGCSCVRCGYGASASGVEIGVGWRWMCWWRCDLRGLGWRLCCWRGDWCGLVVIVVLALRLALVAADCVAAALCCVDWGC